MGPSFQAPATFDLGDTLDPPGGQAGSRRGGRQEDRHQGIPKAAAADQGHDVVDGVAVTSNRTFLKNRNACHNRILPARALNDLITGRMADCGRRRQCASAVGAFEPVQKRRDRVCSAQDVTADEANTVDAIRR